MIEKIKGWFKGKEDSLDESESSDNPWDNTLEFRGQTG